MTLKSIVTNKMKLSYNRNFYKKTNWQRKTQQIVKSSFSNLSVIRDTAEIKKIRKI